MVMKHGIKHLVELVIIGVIPSNKALMEDILFGYTNP